MTAHAILKLDDLEIHTSDVTTVRTLWGLLSTCISKGDLLTVVGQQGPARDE
jgi:hypothetical protein